MKPLRLVAVLMLSAAAPALSGCISDANCGVCDPKNLVLESIGGINYASRPVRLLAPPCEGPHCPGDFEKGSYFVEEIGPCEETPEALESSRGPEEYCKLAPLVTLDGIEFVFNNLLDPESIELVRRRPDNPNLFEVYDWKTQVLELRGPITRYRGDYWLGSSKEPDLVTRLVNLTCIDNLAAAGEDFDHSDYVDPATNPCNRWNPDLGRPVKMFNDGTVTAARGAWDARALGAASGNSCSGTEGSVDTCCSQCDFILGTQVAKYGLTTAPGGAVEELSRADVRSLLARPDAGAIECDPAGDPYLQCRDFVPWVDRTQETRTYRYPWCPGSSSCDEDGLHRIPYYDKLRETHPDLRPADLERRNVPCVLGDDCQDELGPGLIGASCVGTDSEGRACNPALNDDCGDGRCIAPWFVECKANPDTTGAQAYCVDTRFSDSGAPACLLGTSAFEVCDSDTGRCTDAEAGKPLSVCDLNRDGRYDAAECCGQGVDACDPATQLGFAPLPRYQRDRNLPEATRECICPAEGDAPSPQCADYAAACDDRAGEYAVKFVTKRGGIIYDPAVKGFEWRPADVGGVPRAAAESCAEDRLLIDGRNIEDGWRANDPAGLGVESYEDYDRGMCSGQQYTVVFNEPFGPDDEPREYVRDKVGNTLEGKSEYRFETSQFHVVPGSGFPTDNLRIGACDDFALRFSNKYDLSPENLQKLQIVAEVGGGDSPSACELAVELDGDPEPEIVERIAGGVGCANTREEAAESGCHPPCLTVDVAQHAFGQLSVQIDPAEFGRVLDTGETYHLIVPGLDSLSQANEPDRYAEAFWDVCGMPLILGGWQGGAPDYDYEFTIDEPKCKEDEDRDGTPLSCDNAADVFNPDQGDLDRDGVGDVIDLCPTIESGQTNSADSDNDGVGNECDACRQTIKQYNANAGTLGVPAYLQVRNIPLQDDTDHDGIGDVCDNCVRVANCEDFGPDRPYVVGEPIAFDESAVCQRDDDPDMIGDACQGDQADDAAGAVGFGEDDDFDQDGLRNFDDACPRQPVDVIACSGDDDCPDGRACEVLEGRDQGVCNHLDWDGDGVGDICDTCPHDSNPLQVADGAMQEDDEDGDFVGNACETTPACETRTDPRPFAFYDVSHGGLCCVTLLEDTSQGLVNRITREPIVDPDGVPVSMSCNEELDVGCRALPPRVASSPGIVDLPPGCEQALADAGYDDPSSNPRLQPSDFGGDLDALWDRMCFLPQFDQDFDGVGDKCDLCPHDFDPANLPYIDDNNKLWPNYGHYCNGEYSLEARGCGDDPDGEGGTGTGTGTTGEDMGTSGGATSTGGGTG